MHELQGVGHIADLRFCRCLCIDLYRAGRRFRSFQSGVGTRCYIRPALRPYFGFARLLFGDRFRSGLLSAASPRIVFTSVASSDPSLASSLGIGVSDQDCVCQIKRSACFSRIHLTRR
jgi:hypothetical protein